MFLLGVQDAKDNDMVAFDPVEKSVVETAGGLPPESSEFQGVL
jgi:hypothetical protein